MSSDKDVAARAAARPAPGEGPFDSEADVVVVGGGGGGLPTALFSRWLGNEVILLEKAPELGGTAKKAAFWYWVPNNEPMRAAGLTDEREDFLRYVARLSRPTRYDPESPTLGLTAWEHAMASAIYESASPATELLAERGALPYRHCPGVPDYWSELPEDKAPYGRVLVPVDASESMADGGENAVRTLSAAAERDGVDVRTGHRVQRVVRDDTGRVVGVEASTPDGATVRVRARKAVIFSSGGFTHDDELRGNFLNVPAYRGCAAATNEGDFVRIASAVGAQLRNMNYAWMCPVPLERSGRPDLVGMFSVSGDSMLFVDKTGRRVVNEKLPYNELAQTFFRWDGTAGEYPNLVLIQIWDQRSQDNSASTEYGRLIVPPGADDSHVIRGDSLEELTAAVAQRLATVAAKTGGLRLTGDFTATLKDTVARYNEQAAAGRDTDFHRGETAIQLIFNGPVKEEDGRENPTLWPLAGQGPYYAALVTGGTLDTKGGPQTDTEGRVLDDTGAPIPGLYGVGNCVASASAQAYWAGGATLGPILAFAYRAANAAHTETR
ncbi:MAG: 3-oxosteroid 1-dehydrogenase [Pseudonocardiales bacterium]|nr:3-oxosteroid 1-dehydrogenase [Pseudonocardiales bacterium]